MLYNTSLHPQLQDSSICTNMKCLDWLGFYCWPQPVITDVQQASVNIMERTVFNWINDRWGALKGCDVPTFYFCACCCWTLQTQQETFRQRCEIRDKEATASEGRTRLTIIDCQKCQLLSACEWGGWNMLCDTPLNDEQQAPSNCLPNLKWPSWQQQAGAQSYPLT